MPVPPHAPAKQEFLVLNIGSGVQEGSSATVLGVVDSIEAGKELVRKIRGTAAGKIVIAEKKTVVTRVPVVELHEIDETILIEPK